MKTFKEARVRCELFAAEHFGVISGNEAQRLGMTRNAIRTLVSAGDWTRIHPDVYRCVAHPDLWMTRVEAAMRWGGPEAIASHRTASVLWRLDGISEHEVIEISIPCCRSTPGIKSYRFDDPPPARWARGVRLTTVERTLHDLCKIAPAKAVGLAMDDALRKRLTTVDRLWHELETEAQRGRRGRSQFRKLLEGRDDRDGRLRSRFETVMRAILKRLKTPHEVNHQVTSRGRRFYLDFAYPELAIGIEAHSIRWHLGTEKVKEDMARYRSLVLDGWLMLYYSWDDATLRRVEVEQEVREAIATRSLQLSFLR